MKGERPMAPHRRAYQWVYAYHFVKPASRQGHWLILPSVNVEWMGEALKNWVKEVDPDRKKLLVLLIDGAGWHKSKKLPVPENVLLYPLPSYTPELQPVESTWPLLREAVANRFFKTISSLKEKLIERCRYLFDNPDLVKGRTNWHWIAAVENLA